MNAVRGKNMKDEKKFPFALAEWFDNMNTGVLLLNKNPPAVTFSNHHFKKLAKGKETLIIQKIFKNLEEISLQKSILHSNMEVEKDFVVGYTIYQLAQPEYLVCLNDISYKRIYFENKGENHFYDRLSELTAEVAHEIGNPLTSVITTLQVLNEGLDTWDIHKTKEYVQRSIDELDRLSVYLTRMRKFSTVSDRIQNQPVNLKSVIDKVITQNKTRITGNNISVLMEVDQSVMIFVDENAFGRVLLNLFLNSIEILSQSQGGKISIQLEKIDEFFVKLIFKDNGPPIPEEVINRIFMPFYTSPQESRAAGLAVLLKLMTRMGGKMAAETPEQGWGSKFVLYIPLTPISEDSL